MDITSIIQHVFKQPSLDGVSVSELEKFTTQHPFFVVGQYLLLKKMKDTHHPGYDRQLQKTRLYFENPLWLQQLLNRKTTQFKTSELIDDSTKLIPVEEEVVFEKAEQPVSENGVAHDIVIDAFPIVEFVDREDPDEIIPAVEVFEEEISIKKEAAETPISEQGIPITEPGAPEIFSEIKEVISDELLVHGIYQQEAPSESTDTEEKNVEIISESFESGIAESAHTNKVEIIEEPSADHVPQEWEQETVAENQEPELPSVTETYTGEEIPQPVQETETKVVVDESAPVSSFPEIENEEIKPAPQKEEELVFQAYHTIDYFASLGIKISQKIETKDKLGAQLKSFTEWLKMMKRLPPGKLEQDMEAKDSEQVVEMAAHSIEQKEVLTETMAEVLLKQGKKDSAIEVYHKLSLLNPAKTPYFAAKIEALKHN